MLGLVMDGRALAWQAVMQLLEAIAAPDDSEGRSQHHPYIDVTVVHAMTEVASPGGCEGLGAEIQKIEGHLEEQHQSTKLRAVGDALERGGCCSHDLGRDR
jgi:hypothetical protein